MTTILTRSVFRRTLASITATIRPTTTPENLHNLVRAGVTIFRINLSHYSIETQEQWRNTVAAINNIAESEQIILSLMLDTMGPEFRVSQPDDTHAHIEKVGETERKYIEYGNKEVTLTFSTSPESPLCTTDEIAVYGPYTSLKETSKYVVFGDGKYRAAIVKVNLSDKISMIIRPEGRLRVWHRSKVNFPGTSITAPTISASEAEAIRFFVNDLGKSLMPRTNFMFAQSFVKSATDVIKFSGLLNGLGIIEPIIIAKMETYESSREDNLISIVAEASAVMIARGDLANETARQEVPQLQRRIIKAAKSLGKPVLLATQIYNSMRVEGTEHCTRPEAEDVRSALEWGVDGFVLTEETTDRSNPERVVKALTEQIERDEKDLIEGEHYRSLRKPIQEEFQHYMRDRMVDPHISPDEQRRLGTRDFAIAAVFRANTYRAIGIFPFTAEGGTVRAMSEFYPETQIYALTPNPNTAQLLLLHRCTHPILIEGDKDKSKAFGVNELKVLVRKVVNVLKLRDRLSSQYAIATIAHPPLQPGGTDTLLRIRLDIED